MFPSNMERAEIRVRRSMGPLTLGESDRRGVGIVYSRGAGPAPSEALSKVASATDESDGAVKPTPSLTSVHSTAVADGRSAPLFIFFGAVGAKGDAPERPVEAFWPARAGNTIVEVPTTKGD